MHKTTRGKPEDCVCLAEELRAETHNEDIRMKDSSSQTQVRIRVTWKACFTSTSTWVTSRPILTLILSLKWCPCFNKDPTYSNTGCPSSMVYKH